MDSHKVPRDVINKMILEYCKEYPDENYETLSVRAGLNQNFIRGSLRDRVHNTMEFCHADKILCAINRYDEWWESPLEEYYWDGQVPPDKSKPLVCAREDCDNSWSLDEGMEHTWRKKFCSNRCRSTDHARKAYAAGKVKRNPEERARANKKYAETERGQEVRKKHWQKRDLNKKRERDRARYYAEKEGLKSEAEMAKIRRKRAEYKRNYRARKKANAETRQRIPEDVEVQSKNGA